MVHWTTCALEILLKLSLVNTCVNAFIISVVLKMLHYFRTLVSTSLI